MSPNTSSPYTNALLAAIPTAPSPVDSILSLSPTDKHAVFMTLLRELVQFNGDSDLLPIEDESGEPFGYFVPPKAAAELTRRSVPPQSEADIERTRKALASLDDTFDIDEIIPAKR